MELEVEHIGLAIGVAIIGLFCGGYPPTVFALFGYEVK